MKRHLFLAILLFLAVCPLALQAQENSGATCDDAIIVTDGFSMHVEEATTLWFTAWTYDLPMTLTFHPDDPYSVSPTGWGDFTCTTGVYDDPNMIALVRDIDKWGYTMPIEFDFSLSKSVGQGGNEYELIVESNYRTQMSNYGITYDVQAWVKIDFPGPGTLTTQIDQEFRQCRESSHWLSLPDTIEITPATAVEETFTMPLVEWMNDSVRFIWTGDEALAIAMGTQCDFTINATDPALIFYSEIPQSAGPDTLDMTSDLMREFFNMVGEGGVYYLRFATAGTGELMIDYKPAAIPDNNAILLHKGESVALTAGEISPLYCFPVSWLEKPLEWMSKPSSANVKMFVHEDGFFSVTSAGVTATHEYTFMPSTGTTRSVCWSQQDVWELEGIAQGQYMYVRFFPAEDVTITPTEWNVDKGCMSNSILFLPHDSLLVRKDNSVQIYRLPLQQWKERGQDVTLRWTSYNPLTIYIADTCKFNMVASNVHVMYHTSIPANSTVTIPAATIAGWNKSDSNGYAYARFLVQATDGVLVSRPANQQPDEVFPPLPDEMPSVPTVVESAMDTETISKFLYQGMLLIRRSEQIYTIQGQLWRK